LEATGFRYGNLRQATTFKLVLTCHEAAAVVQSRLRTRMALRGEVVLRLRVCRGSECGAVFFLCSHCDRGHRYCSLACRDQARLRQRRCANRRQQQSPEGRLDHRDRQREYRKRRAQGARQARVTDDHKRRPLPGLSPDKVCFGLRLWSRVPFRSLARHYSYVDRWKRSPQKLPTNPARLHSRAGHRLSRE